MPSPIRQLRRVVELTLGWAFVGLALMGAFLPLLPTTPFLLLASFLFVRSSPRCHAWLLRNRLLGPFLRDWERHRGVRPAVKWVAVCMVLTVAGCSLASGRLTGPLQFALVGLCATGLVVVCRLPTIGAATDVCPAEPLPSVPQEIHPAA